MNSRVDAVLNRLLAYLARLPAILLQSDHERTSAVETAHRRTLPDPARKSECRVPAGRACGTHAEDLPPCNCSEFVFDRYLMAGFADATGDDVSPYQQPFDFTEVTTAFGLEGAAN